LLGARDRVDVDRERLLVAEPLLRELPPDLRPVDDLLFVELLDRLFDVLPVEALRVDFLPDEPFDPPLERPLDELFFCVRVFVWAMSSVLSDQLREPALLELRELGPEPFRLRPDELRDERPFELDRLDDLLLTSPSSIFPRQPSSASSSSSAWALNRCRSPRTARFAKRIPRPAFSSRLSGLTSRETSMRVSRGASSWNVTTPV
jgi:hypothetical protein